MPFKRGMNAIEEGEECHSIINIPRIARVYGTTSWLLSDVTAPKSRVTELDFCLFQFILRSCVK